MRSIRLAVLSLVVCGGAIAATPSLAETFAYSVTVKTSFGTRFKDCFTFDQGKLTFADGEIVLPFAPAPTSPKYYYVAVSGAQEAANIGFGIAFAGFKVGNNSSGKVHAVGSNSRHNSYTVEGASVASCSSDAASSGANIASYAGPAN